MSVTERTWRDDIGWTLEYNGEDWSDVEDIAIGKFVVPSDKSTYAAVERVNETTDETLDSRVHWPSGGYYEVSFTVWTKNRVYFPATYDSSEWTASAPRHPNGEVTKRVGGGS